MAEEQSIKDDIGTIIDAMEGLAITAKKTANSGNYEKVEKQLKDINTLGRKLEYRGGGLKILPLLAETEELKLKITQARAAAQTALTSITYLEGVQKNIEKLKKAIEHDENYLKTAPTVTTKFKAVLEVRRGDLAGKEEKVGHYKKDAGKKYYYLN